MYKHFKHFTHSPQIPLFTIHKLDNRLKTALHKRDVKMQIVCDHLFVYARLVKKIMIIYSQLLESWGKSRPVGSLTWPLLHWECPHSSVWKAGIIKKLLKRPNLTCWTQTTQWHNLIQETNNLMNWEFVTFGLIPVVLVSVSWAGCPPPLSCASSHLHWVLCSCIGSSCSYPWPDWLTALVGQRHIMIKSKTNVCT